MIEHTVVRATAPVTRRHVVIGLAACAGGLSIGGAARAQQALLETDPQAIGLGYKVDATQVDKARQPKYAAGQACSNCAIYQGKPTDAAGGCPLFAGKQVAAKGWCTAYVKKPA
jgi:hypothetical protein